MSYAGSRDGTSLDAADDGRGQGRGPTNLRYRRWIGDDLDEFPRSVWQNNMHELLRRSTERDQLTVRVTVIYDAGRVVVTVVPC